MGSPASADKHDYQRCTDANCPRFPCQVYKEGRQLGEEGYEGTPVATPKGLVGRHFSQTRIRGRRHRRLPAPA